MHLYIVIVNAYGEGNHFLSDISEFSRICITLATLQQLRNNVQMLIATFPSLVNIKGLSVNSMTCSSSRSYNILPMKYWSIPGSIQDSTGETRYVSCAYFVLIAVLHCLHSSLWIKETKITNQVYNSLSYLHYGQTSNPFLNLSFSFCIVLKGSVVEHSSQHFSICHKKEWRTCR